jgi:enoyl-CoA hydratase
VRHVRIEEEGDVAVVRIDRPPANAMDLELLEDGHAALEQLTASEPGAVVMTGREGFFSAGVDLKLAPTLDPPAQRAMVEGINRLFAGWYAFPRPLVAAVNGHAIAGGLILALCADYLVGGGDGRVGLTELRAGIPYPLAAMTVVRAELSPKAARQLVLQAELVFPEEAYDLGVLDEVVPPALIMPRAVEVAQKLAALPRSAYGPVKHQLRAHALRTLEGIGQDPLLDSWMAPEAASPPRASSATPSATRPRLQAGALPAPGRPAGRAGCSARVSRAGWRAVRRTRPG